MSLARASTALRDSGEHGHARVRIGEVFRVTHGVADPGTAATFRSYAELTRGAHLTSADVQKGIWAYKPIRVETAWRVPALLLHSNSFKGGTEYTPWVDVIEPDAGYALFHGDNRSAVSVPLQTRGNKLLADAYRCASDPSLRATTPPILLFNQKEVAGNRKGFREFCGFGIVKRLSLATQKERGGREYFTNVVAELALFRLDHENEQFDWSWIDLRRNPSVSDAEALQAAPAAWRDWVDSGDNVVEHCRRRVTKHSLTSADSQLPRDPAEAAVLAELSRLYESDPHSFEGLASLIACRVIGPQCIRGWVTARSGDGGVDFVSRLSVGSGFASTHLVVLGQAKCTASVSGRDLARLVARLQRGWLGAFVTTGVFTQACQRELVEDKYPIVLVNGARVAREIRLLLSEEAISLGHLVDREKDWYVRHLSASRPERVLDDSVFNTVLAL